MGVEKWQEYNVLIAGARVSCSGCGNLETNSIPRMSIKAKKSDIGHPDNPLQVFWKIPNPVCPLKCAYFKQPYNKLLTSF